MSASTRIHFSFLPSLSLAAILGVTLQLGCGGGDPGPQPLRYHFDEMYVAQVPLEQRGQMEASQNEYYKAKMAHAQAQSRHSESADWIAVAKNEKEQANIAEKTARTKKQAAEKSADMNRVSRAMREQRAADLRSRAASEKINYLKQERRWLKDYLRYTQEDMYAKEAAYELAKARLARSKQIKPPGFEFQRYEKQRSDRSRSAQKAKQRADRDKSKVTQAKAKWKKLKAEADKAGSGTAKGTGAKQQ